MMRALRIPGLALAAAAAAVAVACGGSSEAELPPATSAAKVEVRELPPMGLEESRAAIRAFEAATIDPHAAPRVTIPGECGGIGFESLEASVENADAIVIGRVSTIEFLFDGETQQLVRLEIEQVIRGDPRQLFVLNVSGGPRELDGSLVLTQHATNPLLLPGDRGLFLLQKMSLTAAYVPQGISGQYRFDADGGVTTVAGNPFAASIEKMSADSLVKKVRKLAAG